MGFRERKSLGNLQKKPKLLSFEETLWKNHSMLIECPRKLLDYPCRAVRAVDLE